MKNKEVLESRIEKRKKKKSRKRIWRYIGYFLAIVLLAGTVYGVKAYLDVQNSLNKIQSEVNANKLRDSSVNIEASQPFSVLLLGTDTGIGGRTVEQDGERSDTMIVLTVNPKEQTTTMVSIPRDSYVEIAGNNTYDKINHAYAFGKAEMSINTVQKMLNIPIDYYIVVNMKGLSEIVDAVGGIDITSPLTFTFDDIPFEKDKPVTLDGMRALAFSRMRYEDPEGDYGRQQRQRMVIEAILRKALSLQSLTNYGPILSTIENNVLTNLSFNEIMSIQSKYQSSINNFSSATIQGDAMMINNIFYFYIQPEELLRVSNLLRSTLGLQPSTMSDLNIFEVDKTQIIDTDSASPYELEVNQVQPEYSSSSTSTSTWQEVDSSSYVAPSQPQSNTSVHSSSSSYEAPETPQSSEVSSSSSSTAPIPEVPSSSSTEVPSSSESN
ncbi:LCP family glycopolymer transferase [Granulicatella seriolae]|uniref:LCP family protein n=1 Tax=Granulicatella seriolae TaxID=2967226 RepID=A0ABT1WN42_9LACT|nr:LCP family protein [Granulicatella seriolae]